VAAAAVYSSMPLARLEEERSLESHEEESSLVSLVVEEARSLVSHVIEEGSILEWLVSRV
jgi:hypothetical protein